ncbi:putative holin-like toxin [Paenibacillus sp. Marseille-Q9583]
MSIFESLSLMLTFGSYTVSTMAVVISVQALKQTKK